MFGFQSDPQHTSLHKVHNFSNTDSAVADADTPATKAESLKTDPLQEEYDKSFRAAGSPNKRSRSVEGLDWNSFLEALAAKDLELMDLDQARAEFWVWTSPRPMSTTSARTQVLWKNFISPRKGFFLSKHQLISLWSWMAQRLEAAGARNATASTSILPANCATTSQSRTQT